MNTLEQCALIRNKVAGIQDRIYCERIMNTVNRLGARAACKKYGRHNIMRALAYLRTELGQHHTGVEKCA